MVDPAEVPVIVMERAQSVLIGGDLKKAEKILDADRNPLEYHFKLEKNGKKYKLVVSLMEDAPVVLYRETLAEIEVPVQSK